MMNLIRRLYCAFVGHQWIHNRLFLSDHCVIKITCYRCDTNDGVTIFYPRMFNGIDHLITTGYADD